MAALPMGGTLEGAIQTGNQVDTHWFYVPHNNAKVQFSVDKISGTNFTAKTEIFSPSGVLVPGSLLAGSGIVSKNLNLMEAGNYLVKVSSWNRTHTGNYVVGVERLDGLSPDHVMLSSGAELTGHIGKRLEIDQYVFWGKRNARVDLSVHAIPTAGSFAAHVDLVTPSGQRWNLLRSNDYAHFDQVTLNEDGFYKLHIRDDNYRDFGTYRVALEGLSPMSSNSLPIPRGSVQIGDIAQPLDQIQYRFYARTGNYFQVSLASVPQEIGFAAYAEVYNPAGHRIEIIDSSRWNHRAKDFQTHQDGFYTILVRDRARRSAGQFRVSLNGINPINLNPIFVQEGTVFDGQISDPIQRKQYVLYGQAFQRFQLIAKSTPDMPGFFAKATVYSEIGEKVAEYSNSSTISRFTLPRTGRYVIQMEDSNLSRTGTFSVSLERLSPRSQLSTALPVNTVLAQSLSVPLDHRQFHFHLAANSTINIEVRGGAEGPTRGGGVSDGVFRASYEIIAPNGDRSGRIFGNKIRPFTAQQSGLYILLVHDDFHDAIGNFTVRRF